MTLRVSRRAAGLAALGMIAIMGGCALNKGSSNTAAPARPGSDLPGHFLVLGAGGPAEPAADGACRSPLVDPRDQTRLTLIRSHEGLGDYEPAPARYGVTADELLRVDCASGRPIGIVRR